MKEQARITVYILYNSLIALITKSCSEDHMAAGWRTQTHTHTHHRGLRYSNLHTKPTADITQQHKTNKPPHRPTHVWKHELIHLKMNQILSVSETCAASFILLLLAHPFPSLIRQLMHQPAVSCVCQLHHGRIYSQLHLQRDNIKITGYIIYVGNPHRCSL